MGTRADFYVGKGEKAEWLGSIAWDGYRDGIPGFIRKAKRERDFREAVSNFLQTRDDATLPEQGWPWPWNDSGTTDCSYWFFDKRCWDVQGYPTDHYFPCDQPEPEEDGFDFSAFEVVEFPDMSGRKNVTLGKRSGAIFVTAR